MMAQPQLRLRSPDDGSTGLMTMPVLGQCPPAAPETEDDGLAEQALSVALAHFYVGCAVLWLYFRHWLAAHWVTARLLAARAARSIAVMYALAAAGWAFGITLALIGR